MTTSRREFLACAGAAAGVLVAGGLAPKPRSSPERRGSPLKLLILGGTGFLGPHVVWDALEHGHEVTLFNRGQTNPELFAEIETLTGDRYGDYASLQAEIAKGRRWDGVVDTFAYVPKVVEDAIGVLGPGIGRYVLISTMSVYAGNDTPGADESDTLAAVSDETAAAIPTHREVGANYGAMKARCEAAAERLMPGRVANLRPGLICGPRDTTGRFSYWPIRAAEGGTMIAPGRPSDPIQIIDVRDLARFTVRCIEQGIAGVYNAITPEGELTIGAAVDASIQAAGSGAEAEWIDAGFLASQGVQAWQHMPAWVSSSTPGYAGFGRQSSARAHAAGLTCRPALETARGVLEYFRTRGPELEAERGAEFVAEWRRTVRGGLPAEREAEVLAAWLKQNG
jgi:2'-hydroxyisoflavone reductase